MCYQQDFLVRAWTGYLAENKVAEEAVDPDAFVRWTYAQALEHRQPRYEAMANWGVTVTAEEVAGVTSPASFDDLIAAALEKARA
jgi:hypothetical protein